MHYVNYRLSISKKPYVTHYGNCLLLISNTAMNNGRRAVVQYFGMVISLLQLWGSLLQGAFHAHPGVTDGYSGKSALVINYITRRSFTLLFSTDRWQGDLLTRWHFVALSYARARFSDNSVSVCLSICLSHAGVESKLITVGSHGFHGQIAYWLYHWNGAS